MKTEIELPFSPEDVRSGGRQGGWKWYASRDEENCTVGPEASREAIIAAATRDYDGERFHIVEARQMGDIQHNARPVEGRKIPRSWFTATHRASTMAVLTRSAAQERVTGLEDGDRRLGWFVLPPFQRPSVWTREQQARFVESCWLGLPIGIIIYNRPTNYGSRFENWLLDGQQRITALYAYMNDEFPVFGSLFSELTVIDMRYWDMSTALPMAETNIEDEEQLRDIYDRLAYGGTPHEPKA